MFYSQTPLLVYLFGEGSQTLSSSEDEGAVA